MAKLTKWAIFLRAFLAAMVASSAYGQVEGFEDESAEWSQVQRTGTAEAYFLYLRRHPRGAYVAEAMQALEQLELTGRAPEVDFEATGFQLY